MPTSDRIMVTYSTSVWRRMAARMPAGSPTSNATNRAARLSSMVGAKLVASSTLMSPPVRIERPSCSVAVRDRNSTYCSGSGRLSPSSWRKRSISCGLAFSPARILAPPPPDPCAAPESHHAPVRCSHRTVLPAQWLRCRPRVTDDVSGQAHVVEVVDVRWLRHEALHSLADGDLLLRVADEQPRRVIDDALLRLAEQVLALGRVGFLIRLVEQLVDFRHAVERRVDPALVGAVEK